jgi:hypothetical protein
MWPDRLITIFVALISTAAVLGPAIAVDRRLRRAWEQGAALRAQQSDGEIANRLRTEIARLDVRVDEADEENTRLRKRVAILEDTLRVNHIAVPPCP